MSSPSQTLGILTPLGGGDPIPLLKDELVVGRRPTCNIQLNYENVSGKHCILKFHKGVWHIRDLSSRNGTTINGSRISTEHAVMPDDEVGIATHLYRIDYDPVAPSSLKKSNQFLEEEGDIVETRKRTSLVELAGISADDDAIEILDDDGKPIPDRRSSGSHGAGPRPIHRPSAAEAEFDDPIPDHLRNEPKREVVFSDDEFFQMIQEDVKKKKDR